MQRRDTAALTAAAGLALSFAPTLMRRPRRAQLALSAASIGLGGLAGTATELLVMRLARELDGGEVAARRLLVGAGAASILTELPESPHAAVALAGQSARLAGICALIGAVAPEHEVVPLERPRTLIALCAAGAAAVVGWQQLDRRLRPRRPRLEAFPAEHTLGTVSALGGGFEGSRFVGTATDGLAHDPVRVFVGVDAAAEVADRARLAVDELERLGGFDRRRIVVCSPTLRGYVNPIPLAAEECLAGGDVASVTVQYHDRRTLLMPLKVPIAARTHRARARGAARPRARGRRDLRLRREPRGVGVAERVPGRRGAGARRGAGRARALDRHAVLLPAAAAAGERRDPDGRAGQLGRGRRPARGRRRARRALRVRRAAHGPGGALPRPGPDLAPAGLAAPPHAGRRASRSCSWPSTWSRRRTGRRRCRRRWPTTTGWRGRWRWTSRSATTRRARGSPSWPTGSSRTRSRAARGSEHCGARTAILQGIDNAFPDRVAARLKARHTTIA